MNYARRDLAVLLLSALVSTYPAVAGAVPVTGGTGPGGVGTTDGSSTLQLWVKADSISAGDLIAGEVNVWTNRAGTAFTPTATGSGARPDLIASVFNGLPAVRFNGTSDGINTAAFAGSVNRTLFVVSANSSQATWAPVIMQSSNGGISYGWISSNLNRIYNVEDNVALEALSTVTFAPNQLVQSTSRWTGSGNQLYLNGALDASDADTVTGPAAVLEIGHRSAQYYVGDIAEVAVFNSALNSTQRNIVENALSSKYGYAMNSPGTNDHYAGDAGPANFDFGVFGIGNDGTSSVTSAGHEGLGIEQLSISSGQWVLAGRANGANGTTSNDVSNGQRWERSWNIDTTGAVGAVDLAFDWSDAGVTTAFDPTFLALYKRATNSGPFTLVSVGTIDLINQRVNFSGVTLTDGNFYTLGTLPVPEPSSLVLLGFGSVAIVIRTRRGRRVAS